jgi:HPt (histidine-containing phosphotransfer) domain-containing protein
VARSPEELYELFLALAAPRLASARRALALPDPEQRRRELEAALIPLGVDAALLGIQGMSALCRAVASSPDAPAAELGSAIELLARAVEELGRADASGARTDETRLVACAARLEQAEPRAPAQPARPPAPAPQELELGGVWQPELGEDMIAAFLDECSERLEGLSDRLLRLEQVGSDPALVAEIFRDLHTLKGSSGFAGLKSMNRVAHLAEDLMGELREGKRACDRAVIDVLLETLDTLRVIVDRARDRKPIDLDLSLLLGRLRDPRAAPAPSSSDLAARPPSAEPTPVQSTLRIDFAKVDLLLNLVGEAVLARGRLTAASDTQAGLLRELRQLRAKLAGLARE